MIRESGLLPFYLNQDEIKIDDQLLSGFCMANYSIAKELNDSIDILMMKNNFKILFEEFGHKSGEKIIMAIFCNKSHINEGIKNKMKYIFDKYFRDYDFSQPSVIIKNENIKQGVSEIINDVPLQNFISQNREFIASVLNPIMEKPSNEISAYALASSTNQILYYNYQDEIFKYRGENHAVEPILDEYLRKWNVKNIPQGDTFKGVELVAGLDLVDFVESNRKTFGLCINTSINLKKEPNNEVLLYLFGKTTLMRQCCFDIEEILRENLY